MKYNFLGFFFRCCSFFFIFSLAGCLSSDMRPLPGLNDALFDSSNSYREPTLSTKYLVSLVNYNGKDKVEMIDRETRKRIPLPGLNRADSQPISISISSNGDRLALIRQRSDKTELLLYRRKVGTMQQIELIPKGIPRRVSLDSSGRLLAVQVSRDGRWDVEVIRLRGS